MLGALRFYISFHVSLKKSIYSLKLRFHQNLSFIKWTLGISLQKWHINLPKNLAQVLEEKITEKDRFSGQKWWTDRDTGQPTQSVRVPVNWLPLPSRGPVEKSKKHSLSLPVAFPSQSRYLSSRSRSNWG